MPLAQRRRVRCVWQVGRLKSRELTPPRLRGRGLPPGLAGAGSQEARPAREMEGLQPRRVAVPPGPTRVFRGPLRLTGPDKGDQVGKDAEQGN